MNEIHRLMGHISKLPNGCWEWTGGKDPDGYGIAHFQGKSKRAPKTFYELLVEKVPEGLHLDHLCRNRACVNPKHLEPVTPRENILRGFGHCGNNARKTHCINGHQFNQENTGYVKPNKWHKRGRYCLACKKVRADRYNKSKAGKEYQYQWYIRNRKKVAA